MAAKRRVVILVPATFGYNEGVLRGIVRYARERGNWVTMWQNPEEGLLEFVSAWKPDGAVAYLNTKPQAAAVLSYGYPVVNISGNLQVPGVPRVSAENTLVAKMAVDYFWDRGFRNFACLTTRRRWFHKQRDVAFSAEVEARGAKCSVFTNWFDVRENVWPGERDPYPRMREWIKSLPLPTALFAVQDTAAVAATDAIHECGLRIPDDIAVLGADNSETLCMLANPNLSSIELGLEDIGMRAGEMLDRVLDGEDLRDQVVLVPPLRVIERQSTDVVAVEDEDVSAAMRYILANAATPITVQDVLRQVAVSRRVLEQRFRKHVKSSPLQMIHQAHVARARALLSETDLSMPQVAAGSGFVDAASLSKMFRKTMSMTPTAYRRKVRYERT